MPRVNAGDPPGRKRVKSEPGVYDMGKGKRKAVHEFGSGGDPGARFLSEMQKYADKVLSSGAHDKEISDAAEKHERFLNSIEQWQHHPNRAGQRDAAVSQGKAGPSYPPTTGFVESARPIHTAVRNDRGEEPSRGKAEARSVPCEVVSNVEAMISDLRCIQSVILDNRCRQHLVGSDLQLLQNEMKAMRAIIHGHAQRCTR